MIYDLDHIEDILIPENKRNNICLDIGLGAGAPQSARWLFNDPAVFVIGVEPNKDCLKSLIEGPPPRRNWHLNLKEGGVCTARDPGHGQLIAHKIKSIDENDYALIMCAIDNIEKKTEMEFYSTDETNIGCSSLLKPTATLEASLKEINKVDVVSLEEILNRLKLHTIKEIPMVKTDTQGKDYDVVKSLGSYLPKVRTLKCEYNVGAYYENPNSPDEFAIFMEKNNFTPIAKTAFDVYLWNTRFNDKYNPMECRNIIASLLEDEKEREVFIHLFNQKFKFRTGEEKADT